MERKLPHDFKIGDKVKVITGGPIMTVIDLEYIHGVRCLYPSGPDDILKEHLFRDSELLLIEPK